MTLNIRKFELKNRFRLKENDDKMRSTLSTAMIKSDCSVQTLFKLLRNVAKSELNVILTGNCKCATCRN